MKTQFLACLMSGFLFFTCAKPKVIDIPGNYLLMKKLSGNLEVKGTSVPLIFNIYRDPKGELISTMDSPLQSIYGIKTDEIVLSDSNIFLAVSSIKGIYEGEKIGPNKYKGVWTQGKNSFPLTIALMKRPQEPVDFPYIVEDVVFSNKEENFNLAGTLTTPYGDGPFPVVVLISGSGPQNRNEEIMGHKPFLVLSDYFTRYGIAVLRYDDRGVGDSQGDRTNATTVDYANDAEAAVNYLISRNEFSNVGLAGHSEGGIIAPIVATQSKNVNFIILMGGTGLPGKEILKLQGALILQQTKISSQGLKVHKEVSSSMIEIVVEEKNNKIATEKILPLFKAYNNLSEKDQQIIGYDPKTFNTSSIKRLLDPWMRFFISYDPRPALEKVKIPVLAINGEKDLQVPPKENLSEIKAALQRGGNKNYEIHELKDLNHLFQTSQTGAILEYGSIEETFDEEAMDLMTQWILRIK